MDQYAVLGYDYVYSGQFERSLEFFDKAIGLSPLDPALRFWHGGKSLAYFGLKQYAQAIESARRAIAISPDYNPIPHANLIAALALTGHGAEANETLQRYLALPSSGQLSTITAWKAFYKAKVSNQHSDPRVLESYDRAIEGLRKAGMAEE